MSIILYLVILSFVLTNVVLGCYVAILLGYGPPTGRAALKLLFDIDTLEQWWDRIRQKAASLRLPTPQKTSGNGAIEEKSEPQSTAPATEEKPLSEEEEMDSVIEKLTTGDIGDLLEDESDDISNLAPMQEIFDDDLASALEEQGTEVWLVNEKHVETSLLKLNVVMMKSGRFASELDWRIRSARGLISEGDIRQFLAEMKDDCRNYLESQAAITQQMLTRLDEFGELKYLAEEVDYANMEQSAQIETTLSNLDHLVLRGNPEDGATRLLKELGSLRIARHRLRDMQDRTFMKIVSYEDRLDTIPQQLYIDENSGIRGRIGLEVAIHAWWKQKRHQTRQITFALLDFVKFGEANEEHGITVCDKIIKQFGRDLESRFESLDLIGIYNGNCFLVATINAGPKKTIAEIERIRQRLEKTTYKFDGGNNSLQLQVTCAITEALATQSQADVLNALESTLAFAKKAGRNHTFHFVPGPLNKPPEKVDAPNLGEEPKEIEIV